MNQVNELNTPKKLRNTEKNSQRHYEGCGKLEGGTRLDGEDCNN